MFSTCDGCVSATSRVVVALNSVLMHTSASFGQVCLSKKLNTAFPVTSAELQAITACSTQHFLSTVQSCAT